MYNLLIAGAISIVAAAFVVVFGFPWYTGIVPGLIVFPLLAFVLLRRTTQQVEAAMRPIQAVAAEAPPRTQAEANERMAKIRATMESVKAQFGYWQPMLSGQIDAQLGVLDYQQGLFDEALPKLQASYWKDGMTNLLIGCIYWRKDQKADARKAFADAVTAAPKEAMNYLVPAVLYSRAGDRDAALTLLGSSGEQLPAHPQIKALKARLANKQDADVSMFADAWRGFFPEEMQQDLLIRGRRQPSAYEALLPKHMQSGPPAPKSRGKMARRR